MFFILLMAILDVIVLSLMKYQLLNYNPAYFLLAFLFYGCQPILFYLSLKSNNSLAINNLAWDLTSDLLVLVFAIIVFKEFFTKSQVCGIILAFIALYLLNVK